MPVELEVSGSIPAYAAGTLYRTGPGGYKVETVKGRTWAASHWFDGFSQVHRFHILPPSDSQSTTRVIYNSRHSVDTLVEDIRKTGSLAGFTFGQKRDPCQSFFKKVMSTFTPASYPEDSKPDSRNIGVTLSINMPGLEPPKSPIAPYEESSTQGITSLMNKTDSNAYQFLDPSTLEPLKFTGQSKLHPSLDGPMSAAHAQTDPISGDTYNYNLSLGKKPTYRVFHVSTSTQETTILATITTAPAAYLHSLFLTENHVILCVWGSHYALRGLSLLYSCNILDSISPLDPCKPCLWYVIDRTPANRGVLATYTTPPFFSFHTVNAYSESSPTHKGQTDIVADVAIYDDLSVLKRFYYDNLKSSSPGALAYIGAKGDSTRSYLARFRLPGIPSTPDKCSSSTRTAFKEWATSRSQLSLELPTMNPSYTTFKHRYIYGVTDSGFSTFLDGLAKFDTITQQPLFWRVKGHSPGEPIFVADPEAGPEEEDRGVLLSVVLDGYAGKSYLLVLDAKTMREVGRAAMEGAVGFGFHGAWVGNKGGEKVKGNVLDA